ncbi:ATP-grasp domain-containing protein [Streptomyces malaysiense]|uniref:Biotin carboxylase n=1 Tax=Streptomyces malaysiense TaxID=1428626 RepID=A0A1J4Q037_9ACTN|nr:ATP-grasp domain-containing protein [Streptomyces malaysiense]OIK26346.1 biotin carboxylase [Streptomyces malaysiense]
MKDRLLLLIESNTTGTGRRFAQRAVAAGIEPVLLSADPGRYPYAAEDGLRTVVVDTADPPALWPAVRELAADAEIAGVLSSSEYFVATAAEVAARLGLPGPSADAVRACRDKASQRRLLAGAGVPVPGFAEAGEVAEAVGAASRLGLPVVVKPVQGSGSVGVRLCASLGEVADHAGTLLAATANERGLTAPTRILVESYLTGREFSVEVVGHEAVAVVAKHVGPPPVFVETGHDLPAALPARQRDALTACAVAAVRALGLGWGAAHVELRLDGAAPRVIEVNPRPAGGMIPELVRHAHGIDLVTAQVRAAAGLPVSLERDRDAGASIRFLTADAAGTLGPAAAVEEALSRARAVPGVVDAALYRAPEAPVGPAEDFRGRLGHVITTGPSAAASARAAQEAAAVLARALRPSAEPSAVRSPARGDTASDRKETV